MRQFCSGRGRTWRMAPGESLDSIQSGDTWVGGYLGGRISHTLAHCPVLPPGWLPPTVSMSTGKEAPDPKTLPGVTVPTTAGPEPRPPDPEPLALLPPWPPPAPRDVSHRNRSVRTALQVSKSSQAPGKCPLAYVLCPHPCPHPDPLLPPQTPGLPPLPADPHPPNRLIPVSAWNSAPVYYPYIFTPGWVLAYCSGAGGRGGGLWA